MGPANFLFLDTSSQRLALYKPAEDGAIQWQSLNPNRERYSEKVKDILNAGKIAPADLGGIVVMQGRGSFSDTRAGVLVANLMLENLDIPLCALETQEGDEVWVKALENLKKEPIEADYYAEPNITQPK